MASWRIVRALQAKKDAEKQGKEKVADRPHPWTIRLALLSPALAVVATVISVSSYRLSEKNLKIGQRAYLSVKNDSLETVRAPATLTPGYALRAIAVHRFEIVNLGRTPGTIERSELKVVLPEGWTEKGREPHLPSRGIKMAGAWEGHLAQESSVVVDESIEFFLNDAAAEHYTLINRLVNRKFGSRQPLLLECTFTVRDIFGDKYSVVWTSRESDRD